MKNPLKISKKFTNAKAYSTLLLIVNVLIFGSYIWHVNAASTAGYTMRDFESSIEDMQTELVRLDLEVARLQSIDSVTTRVQMLGLTQVENIEYVQAGNTNVAVNR